MTTRMQNITLGFSVLLSDKKNRSVTVFEDPLSASKSRIRLTRQIYRRGRGDARYGAILVSIGRPAFRECEFLKLGKKAKTNPKRYWINRRLK